MVAGQPVLVQLPARKTPWTEVTGPGREAADPGTGAKVACASRVTRDDTRWARAAAGKVVRHKLHIRSTKASSATATHASAADSEIAE